MVTDLTAATLVMVGVGIMGAGGLLAPALASAVAPGPGADTSVEDEARGADTAGRADEPMAARSLLGVLLVLLAQAFTACQFVLEEQIMGAHALDPLVAVGSEGISGVCATLAGMAAAHMLWGASAGRGGMLDLAAG